MAGEINKTVAKQVQEVEQDYMVCVRVTGQVLVPASALDAEMARCRANGKVCDMDFGELEDIDWNAVYAEDKNGNRIDF